MKFVVRALVAVGIGCGCGVTPLPVDVTRIVLTFDDGPIPPDVALSASDDETTLLAPLRDILATLQQRGIRGVFFVAGPGDASLADAFAPAFATGLREIHEAGHVLGYHCFDHSAAIWANAAAPPWLAAALMNADLNRLEAYLDATLPPAGFDRARLFQPIFRQPFGGLGVRIPEGLHVAAARGWVYRGYRVDSADWTAHRILDPALLAGLPVQEDAEHVAYTRSKFARGASDSAGVPIADVLMHVNHFTAAHLDEWIDALAADFEREAMRPVTFDVPESYLSESSVYADFSIFADLLAPPALQQP
jgi:peptidoglycan/xylan/chitin deacetylase (PgdA/CDA1 family)